jgi:hypothetical protein
MPVHYKESYSCSRETYIEVFCKVLMPKAIDLKDFRINPFIIFTDISFWSWLEYYTALHSRSFTYCENLLEVLYYSRLYFEFN